MGGIHIIHHGQAHQEPLGAPHHPVGLYLYVFHEPHSLYTNPTNSEPPDQIAAAIEGFFWPKIFWDFLTKNLDGAVKPIPVLQTINLIMGLVITAWEWPLGIIAKTALHRSIEARLVVYPLAALSAALLYQATNPAIYYTIGIVIYFWAYSEGEVSFPARRTWPRRLLMHSRLLSRNRGAYRSARDRARYSEMRGDYGGAGRTFGSVCGHERGVTLSF